MSIHSEDAFGLPRTAFRVAGKRISETAAFYDIGLKGEAAITKMTN